MNAGLPGTGISGAFYLLSALWMPFHELYKTLRNKSQPQRMRLILVQSSIALGIIAGIWLTGWLLGELFVVTNAWLALKRGIATTAPSTLPNVIKMTMVFLTIGLLAVVVGSVHLLKLVMRYRQPRHSLNNRITSATAFNTQPSRGEIPYVRSRDAMSEKSEVIC
jgi:cell division protein FtsX